jgi:polyisoprenyl-phosphate glycosyltransferase
MDIQTKKIICLTPVYNDWESFSVLIKHITSVFSNNQQWQVEIVAVNDGSTEENTFDQSAPFPIEVISLIRNVGHQRAIAIGLQYISAEKSGYDYVVVLDSDGEDKPEDLMALVQKSEALHGRKIVFAQRKKRNESWVFKIGYSVYKTLFNWMTGQTINFGNYSCIPARLMKRVALLDNLWNHYSGSIIQSKTPYDKILLDRGKRYAGESKMNFTSLILHGLSSISVYFDFLSVRILKLTLFGVAACILSVVVLLYLKFFTNSSIPGWTSSLILIISGIVLQLFSVTLIVLLLQLSSRKNVIAPNPDKYREFIDKSI